MPALHRAAANPYGYTHRKRRAALVQAALGSVCPGDTVGGRHYRSANCIGVMTDLRRMDLAHGVAVVLGGDIGDRIVCSPCNRGAGAALGNKLRAPKPHGPIVPVRRSRIW